MKPLLALLLCCLPALATAEPAWTTVDGRTLAQAPDRSGADGFVAAVVVTADAGWEAQWNAPRATVPAYVAADRVASGGELQVHFVFANPQRGAGDVVDIRCDLEMIRPDGSTSFAQRDIGCFSIAVPRKHDGALMTRSSLKFVAEPGDLLGTWTVRATIRDAVRGVEVPLQATFEHVAQ